MSFVNDFDDEKNDMSDINMTPLVDVMLVLLIIFIIAVPVITHSVKVDLPSENAIPIETKVDAIQLSVAADGSYFWDDAPISKNDLEIRLRHVADQQPLTEVYISGDKEAAYKDVLHLMASVQRAGLQKLGFISEPNQ